MALLDTLAGELLGPKSVGELSKSTGASADQTKQLVTAALPLLLSGMHQNSTTAAGAESLAKALDKHAANAQKSTSAMLKKADAEDGKKIVSHVLGESETDITRGLARKTGLSQGQVTQMLGMLSPVVLSLVGGQKQEEQQQSQSSSVDLTGLLGSALLGGGYQQAQSSQQSSALGLSSLAGALLGGGSGGSASSGASLLTGLLGGGAQTQQSSSNKPQSGGASSGAPDLSGFLMGLLK